MNTMKVDMLCSVCNKWVHINVIAVPRPSSKIDGPVCHECLSHKTMRYIRRNIISGDQYAALKYKLDKQSTPVGGTE